MTCAAIDASVCAAALRRPALERWKSDDYLATQLGDRRLTVAVTPNGGADAVCAADEPWNGAYEDLFCLPHQVCSTAMRR